MKKTSRPEPPRLAEKFLGWCLPDGINGSSIAGDAREEFAERVARVGKRTTVLWYWIYVAKIARHWLADPSSAAH